MRGKAAHSRRPAPGPKRRGCATGSAAGGPARRPAPQRRSPAEAMSNVSHRSRNMPQQIFPLIVPVEPAVGQPAGRPRSATGGSAAPAAPSPARDRRREDRRATSCARGRAGAPLRPRKHSSPSMPQPKVWAKKTTKLIGTKITARSFDLPSRPSRSHSPNARKRQRHRQREIDEAEHERMAEWRAAARTATVGGRRLWTSRATHSMPATVIGGIDMTTSLVASSSPISLASGTTSRSTPRLPIGSQWKRNHCCRIGLSARSSCDL